MATFKEILEEKKFVEFLQEKQIILNGGKSYGQICFMAGGGGSGKGFAIKNFMEGNKFKVFDVDELKMLFLKIAKLKNKYPEIAKLDLRNPDDVFKLHSFVKGQGTKNKRLDLLFQGVQEGRLPNLLFDITFKEVEDILELLPTLLELGYDKKSVHLNWVLTNYRVAVTRNANRSRVVPEDVLLETHEGAATSVVKVLKGKIKGLSDQKMLDGQINVIMNNQENTIFMTNNDTKETLKDGKQNDGEKRKDANGKAIIKDFAYLNMKESGKPIKDDKAVKEQLYKWIVDNIPKTEMTREIFGKGSL